ncbi:MAG: M23 family metallopeptidase [Rhodospirillaceae bacterium]|nr:M23 family metallopeptidase [Rhodospirillaceae bacterium]MBT5666076.1 M23 family metallopeptidase [Rhodospirillaceae bacterium]
MDRSLISVFLGALFVICLPRTAFPEAPPPRFDLPLDCLAGPDCFVQKYVDHAPDGAYRDYRCGSLSDDGHKGTDFRLRDFKMMERDISVRAAAPGTVVTTRDGMPDVHMGLVGKDAVFDRGLGNAVVIDHGDGWRTIYAHLRRGGVSVTKGQRVASGDPIGVIGLSGLTEFPHVHFQVNHRGTPVDPFTGASVQPDAKSDVCGEFTSASLWRKSALDSLTYQRAFLLHAGFSDKVMKRAALQYGLYDRDTFPTTARNLLFGVFFAGVRAGDVYRLRFFDPGGGVIFDKTGTFPKHSGVRFLTGGKSNRTRPWRTGLYQAKFELGANNAPILDVVRSIEIR